jgi:predicted metal-binding protein
MDDTKALEEIFLKFGFQDYKFMDPHQIVVGHWVRQKCRFGCVEYGHNASCPPNTPPVEECRALFCDYTRAAVFRFEKQVDKPEDRHAWSKGVNSKLVDLEREVFLRGYYKAFLLAMDSCSLCGECTGQRETCRIPRRARPSPESMAVDVYATVRSIDYPIQVLEDYTKAMNRYAFLLID